MIGHKCHRKVNIKSIRYIDVENIPEKVQKDPTYLNELFCEQGKLTLTKVADD